MQNFTYPATLSPNGEGGLIVRIPDVPEVATEGADRAAALENARDALEVALIYRAGRGEPLPPPGPRRTGPNRAVVAVSAALAAKLAIITAFGDAGISKTELARRIGKSEAEVRRILDPRHATKLPAIEAALAAIGHRLVVGVEAA